MNVDEIKELIQIVTESDLAEFKLERDGVKLTLKKSSAFVTSAPPAPVTPVVQTEVVPEEDQVEVDENQTTIVAPMVGTFYRASAPDAEPYVNVGDHVGTGQPVCIIEAMKLMNEIESEFAGTVVKVLVENAQPVDYGQPLFIIEKD